METREIICIMCPSGCRMKVAEKDDGIEVSGQGCARGKVYGVQEYADPRRMVTSTVIVKNGARPLCPCKTASPVPIGKIGEILALIAAARPDAPLIIGQAIIKDAAGTGIDVIATRDTEKEVNECAQTS